MGIFAFIRGLIYFPSPSLHVILSKVLISFLLELIHQPLDADLVWFSSHALVSELLLQEISFSDGVPHWSEPWGRAVALF